jgi:hypothetical protein
MSRKRLKNALLWILAIVLTLSLVVYQRATGPTYPLKGEVQIGSEPIEFRLLRSHDTEINAPVIIEVEDAEVTGKITYKRYKSYDDWSTIDMKREQGKLVSALPFQPAAGKIEYHVSLYKDGKEFKLNEEPAIIRFKGAVPRAVLIPHIFFMFISMLFGLRAGLEAIFKGDDNRYFVGVTLVTLILGGLILGPIVQKYAFDAYWTGWPFGHDLTDNKTLATFLFWLFAFIKLRKNPVNRIWPIIATIVMLAVYIIPHSVLGSEIDHTKTENPVEQTTTE